MEQTTASVAQRETQFQLLSTQLSLAVKVADEAFGGTLAHHKAACHLIGIAAYVDELAKQIRAGLELSK